MSSTVQSLLDFIAAAEKSRKYPSNTAGALRAAIRLFEKELTDEEKESIDTFKDHFEAIYQIVFNKNKANMTGASLETYKRRVRGVLNDFERYGIDPTKIASWNRKPRLRRSSNKSKGNGQELTSEDKTPSLFSTRQVEQGSTMTRFELPLRPGTKAIILTPPDITVEEVATIKGYIEFLEKRASK